MSDSSPQDESKQDESRKDHSGKDDSSKHDSSKDDSGKDRSKEKAEHKPRSRKPLIIFGIVVVVAAIAAFIWWFMTRNQETTDDAYTDGNAVSMAPKVGGYVTDLRIDDNMRVHQGDLLLKIDPRDYIAARDNAAAQRALALSQLHQAEAALALAEVQYPAQREQAEAKLKAARANLTNAQQANARQLAVDRRATTQQNVDTASAQLRTAQAQVAQAQAELRAADEVKPRIDQARANVEAAQAQVRAADSQLEKAQLDLSYTELRAPADGWVTRRNVQQGTLLTPGMTVFALVTDAVWITANFKETQLDRMRPGDKVDVQVDAYPDLELHGHVQSVQLGSGSRFSAFPAENATGNFVKIVQRVPVKIVIDSGMDPNLPLPLGLSVSPKVFVK
jgi:membrane fusion protein (multidrug efflux system)